jgi:hypothetical protein
VNSFAVPPKRRLSICCRLPESSATVPTLRWPSLVQQAQASAASGPARRAIARAILPRCRINGFISCPVWAANGAQRPIHAKVAGMSDFAAAVRPWKERAEAREKVMCRNIKTLFNFEPPATEDEIHASALQFVRKLSGFNKPSQANEAAFDRAVAEVSDAARRLLTSLHTHSPARDREVEAEKARERSRLRFGGA